MNSFTNNKSKNISNLKDQIQTDIHQKSEIIEKSQFKKYIHIKGARSNNLKNIELYIPKNKLVVVTGLSGSGKSSLIIDTLYAEGQRRYVESLSSYARQFLDRMKKPEVDFIKGISPAIAIEQKVNNSNARSTVGSMTEIYDLLRLLYARIGKTYSPITGKEVKRYQVNDIVNYIFNLTEGTKVQILIPLQYKHDRTLGQELNLLLQKGYSRVVQNNQISNIQDLIEDNSIDKNISVIKSPYHFKIIIDRFVVNADEENKKRAADSVSLAIAESEGECYIDTFDNNIAYFNNRFEADGIEFVTPIPHLFNFNNPHGACPKCEGYGKVLGIDPNLVIPNEDLSIYEEAVACWRGDRGKEWKNHFISNAGKFEFPIHRPYKDLNEKEKELLWQGNGIVNGINNYFKMLELESYKIQNRVMISRYRGKATCDMCKGTRLRKEALYIKVGDKNISELIIMPIDELLAFFNQIELSIHDTTIAERILLEIKNRLVTMNEIGLGYLTLDRTSNTLSGGETQRINLTRTLGSNLSSSLYILDEPSVGLHPRDTEKLVTVLKRLRDLGNTVIVIEHEDTVIRNADYIIDIGPMAGNYGGELVFAGKYEELINGNENGITADYITGRKEILIPELKRKTNSKIYIQNARQHNLKNIDVAIPLQSITVVSGLSGSGKTSLVQHTLYPLLKAYIEGNQNNGYSVYGKLSGDLKQIKAVEMINQNPLGRTSRSNPVTYVKAYDEIRKLFANQQLSKIRGFDPKHFSFNVDGGRCDTCKGEGYITVEMQFLADVNIPCEACNSKKFKNEILDVTYQDKNIYDVLELSIEEALEFFKNQKSIITRIQPLYDVGLGYIKLGQSSSTLSGGEAQRVKLASYLAKEYNSKNIFFIFDEPTTGLHFYDIDKLMGAFNTLVENGHTVLIVEHNTSVIKAADWIIDLGPEGGKAGGYVLYEGHPEGLKKIEDSYTAKFI